MSRAMHGGGPASDTTASSSGVEVGQVQLQPGILFGSSRYAPVPAAYSTGDLQAAADKGPPKLLERPRQNAMMRTWLQVDSQGRTSLFHADKHVITHRCAVPLRDLRVLDPGLTTSYSSALLCRERTIVVNLEHVKMLVTAEEVLIPNTDSPEVSPFVAELTRRLTSSGNTMDLSRVRSEPGLGDAMKGSASAASLNGSAPTDDSAFEAAHDQRMTALSDRELPFEFRVLEVALESVCTKLETAVDELEKDAHPALDALTYKVSTANLEGVKKIKGRLTRLQGRVQKVREEINRFLEDDSDMRDMYLTRKAQAQAAAAGLLGVFGRNGSESGQRDVPLPPYDPMDDDADIQQLEDLLETYFTQVDNSFNKLQVLEQYVNDTEDFINIDLDSHRNQLIEIDLMLSFAMFISSLFTLVTGIFGMNLDSGLQEDPNVFREVTVIPTCIVVLGFILFVWVCRRKRLIQLAF